MAMQRLLSKASRHFAQDTLREMASVAPAAPRPGFAQPFEVPWAWLEALPERLLPEPGVKWQDWPDAMDANSMPTLRAGKTDAGALLMQHFTVWDLKLQRRALEKIRSQVLQEPTENLNLQSETGVHNTLLVLRFLHDLESHLEKMNAALQASSNEISPDCDEWAALELFCRPWVLVSGGVELLRVEEFVDPCIRVMMGAAASCALVPMAAMATAWLRVQSPRAWCRLHARRLLGPSWDPCRIQLDKSYRIDASLELPELAEAVSKGRALHLVKGVVPELGKTCN
ncbi:unnamed protein product [Effrenium voratum]|nr:unnamed protein product [Effrenium voratum]